jgi:hypothetical protein
VRTRPMNPEMVAAISETLTRHGIAFSGPLNNRRPEWRLFSPTHGIVTMTGTEATAYAMGLSDVVHHLMARNKERPDE